MSDFDPYYEWLGIPPKDQPPHHYRLLGLDLYENHRTAIDAAANRLMGYLQELSTGEDAEMAQEILNEVSTARVCLLNQKRKATYDRDLKATLKKKSQPAKSAESPTPPPIPKTKPAKKVDTAVATEEIPDSSIAPQIISDAVRTGSQPTAMQRTGRRPTRSPSRKNEKTILLVVIGVLFIAAVCLYILYQQRSTAQNSENDNGARQESDQTPPAKKPLPKQPLKPSVETIIGEAREVAFQVAHDSKTKINENLIGEIPEIVDVLVRPHWETIAQQKEERKTKVYQLAAKHAISLCKQGKPLTAFTQQFLRNKRKVQNPQQLDQEARVSYRQKYGQLFNEEVAELFAPEKE